MELVTGATGYVGGRLLERLLREGRPVRAMARDPAAVQADVEVVRGDVVSGEGLDAALDGTASAYYLVHSMEAPAAGPNGGASFGARDRRAARNFAAAASRAGVERVVYLGGMAPAPGTTLSPHLRSRLEVERILLDASPKSIALRASIVIGARSDSFRILVRLVERLRLLPFPAWRRHRTQPIDERDAIEYLARAPLVPEAAGRSLDIAGPDVLSYGDMIRRIADLMGVGRAPLGLRLSQTPAASAVVSAVAGYPLELVRPLMQSLETDLLPRDDDAKRLFRIRPRSFDRAVEWALREWERAEPLAAR
ncbi:MAG: NAD-dependent epimerase/dehydratase family protein [Actinobacteria bacterium]|nr:MAG: NAD-dependent epimerase/dehydratase family protein [Actinomycetota bacterium]